MNLTITFSDPVNAPVGYDSKTVVQYPCVSLEVANKLVVIGQKNCSLIVARVIDSVPELLFYRAAVDGVEVDFRTMTLTAARA